MGPCSTAFEGAVGAVDSAAKRHIPTGSRPACPLHPTAQRPNLLPAPRPASTAQHEAAKQGVLALLQSYRDGGAPPVSVQEMLDRISATLRDAIEVARTGAKLGPAALVSRGLTPAESRSSTLPLWTANCMPRP